jgi:ribosomal protein S18 acetylase RimI-like enzyme
MTATIVRPAIQVRDARTDDNASLIALATACPMDGDIALAISREPDFFALNRLEGAQWRVGVVEWQSFPDGIAGCVMGAARTAYVGGHLRDTVYAGDLKVHPAVRGVGVADALTEWVVDVLADLGGDDAPMLVTVLAGNRAMERRTRGRGGAAAFTRFATMRAFSIPLLWPRTHQTDRARGDIRVSPATSCDIGEMAELWQRVAPGRQFAPVFNADSLSAWIADAPGLDVGDYRVARGGKGDGRILGFVAWWDQTVFKQSRVLRYSPRLAAARAALNALARFTGGVRLPSIGEPLRYRTALHVCVPSGRPDVLRALVRSSCAELRSERYAFATIGLDARDPLCAAMAGLATQPTDVNAYVLTPRGPYAGPPLDDRPLHYEIALV